jgi:ketosteroid isomerase-like protein
MNLNIAWLFIVIIAGSRLPTGPTAENALAADKQLAMALQNNDTLGIVRMLDKDWAVITSHGDIAEGPDVFPSGIRSGHRMLNAQEVSEPRVRLFGNVAVVTTKVRIAVRGYPREFNERQTDVWRWEDGGWKCILTQESDLVEANPAVSSTILTYEIHPWATLKGEVKFQ